MRTGIRSYGSLKNSTCFKRVAASALLLYYRVFLFWNSTKAPFTSMFAFDCHLSWSKVNG